MSVLDNLVDQVWGETKPKKPEGKVFVHELKYAGMETRDKVQKVADKMKEKAVDVLVVTTLDDIDWILNLRGSDIPYNPVFFSYLVIRLAENAGEGAMLHLFIDLPKVSETSV